MQDRGGVLDIIQDPFNTLVISILGGAQRVAINIFVIISAWFLVEQKFRSARLVKIWLEVLFYTSIITILLVIFGYSVSIKHIIQAFMPYFGKPLWFASAYMSLLMLTPFLNGVFRYEKNKQYGIVLTLFIICCILPTLSSEMDTYLCAVFWFCFIYVFIGVFKDRIISKQIELSSTVCVIFGVGFYVMLSIIYVVIPESGMFGIISKLSARFLHDFKSFPNFAISLLIFIGFYKLKMKNSRIVNWLSAGSFAVYIIHQTPSFYAILWESIIRTGVFEYTQFQIACFVLFVVIIYLIGSLIDYFRRAVIEPLMINSSLVKAVLVKIDYFYSRYA